MKWVLGCVLTALVMLAYGAVPVNFLRNPNFKAGKTNWNKPAYYQGEFDVVRNASDGAFARLKAQGKGNSAYGRVIQILPLRLVHGRLLEFQAEVRGKGVFRLGFIEYAKREGGKITTEFRYCESPVNLNGIDQTVKFRFALPAADTFQIAPFFEVRGEGAVAEIRKTSLQGVHDASTLRFDVPHQVLSGEAAVPDMTVVYRDAKGMGVDGRTVFWSDSTGRSGTKKTDAAGKIRLESSLFAPDVAKVLVMDPENGTSAELYFDRMEPGQFKNFSSLAQSRRLKKPCRILVLGDSLSDFERGRNYMDKLAFFLNRQKPGSVSFRNAGAGGDYITRVLRRLEGIEGKNPAFRQEQYEKLWQDSYDRIFIFLGHNDTRTYSGDQFKTPRVAPDEQEEAYRKAIAMIRKNSRGRIVLISSVLPDQARIAALEQQAKQAGRPFSRFGETARLEAFNAVLRKLAGELDCDYIDLYSVFRALPDRSSYFSPADGVHLTEAGNRLIAGVLLHYFATVKETGRHE